MDRPVFDAASFVEIDLDAGEISSVVNDRLALVPTSVLQALAPSDALLAAASDWGLQHGQRLARQMENEEVAVGIEVLASYLPGTIAALGMGRVGIELHGNALVFRVRGRSGGGLSTGEIHLMSGFLAGYLSALGDHPFRVIHIGEEEGDRLFFAGSPEAIEAITDLVDKGQHPLDAVERLSRGSN